MNRCHIIYCFQTSVFFVQIPLSKFLISMVFCIGLTACGGSEGEADAVTETTMLDTAQNIPTETPVDDSANAGELETTFNNADLLADDTAVETVITPTTELDMTLLAIIDREEIERDPLLNKSIPAIDAPLPQLGKHLFFAKNLGGDNDTACVSCHHPMLGGGDNLSLPIGVKAVDANNIVSANLLGHGRFNDDDAFIMARVPRNSPTVFNVALQDRGLFWDSRVEVLGEAGQNQNGIGVTIITPDSTLNAQGNRVADTLLSLGTSLPAAQARFPVLSGAEMRGDFQVSESGLVVRALLANRFNNRDDDYQTDWPALFLNAYPDGEINFDRIADAIGEYERSMTFVNAPWFDYLAGDLLALSESQKRGAILFFNPENDGGANCVSCHQGTLFSDNRHHLVSFPQIGVGKGNNRGDADAIDNTDFGRENITGESQDRYHFRTPSLLNVALTAPYGHSGAYQTLEQVVRHYDNPNREVENLFGVDNASARTADIDPNSAYCQLPQVRAFNQKMNVLCANTFSDVVENSFAVLARLQASRNNENIARSPLRGRVRLNDQDVEDIVDFLEALTDPCIEDRVCMSPWIIDSNDVSAFPDDNLLLAEDADGNAL